MQYVLTNEQGGKLPDCVWVSELLVSLLYRHTAAAGINYYAQPESQSIRACQVEILTELLTP